MTTTPNQMTREFPNLPLLPIKHCLAIFANAGITPASLAVLSGYTRMAVYNWRNGRNVPLPLTLDVVSTLAYRTLRALRLKRLTPGKRHKLAVVQVALQDGEDKPLAEFTAQELLPPAWVAQFCPEPAAPAAAEPTEDTNQGA